MAVMVVLCVLSTTLIAQAPGTGLYPFGSFDQRGFDSINIGNLNVHFEIPIVNKPGRGQGFQYSLVYDGLIWSPVSSSGVSQWTPDTGWGFHAQLNGSNLAMAGYYDNNQGQKKCFLDPPSWYWAVTTSNYVYHDAFGQQHRFNYATDECTGTTTGDGNSSDGSGYRFNGSNVVTRTGSQIVAPYNGSSTPSSITDSNGNVINNHGDGTFTDTLGVTALTITGGGNPSSPRVFTYKVSNQADGSTTASVSVSYVTYTVQTNFGCSISGYGPQAVDLVDRVTLADGTFYQFTYEDTPGFSGSVTGRISSVTLPTGGTISYSYSGGCNGNGLNADGTIGSLSRVTSDGTRSYTRAQVNANATSTTLQDELTRQSVYQFTINGGLFYETHRQVHVGDSATSVLSDVSTCYNGATSSCDGSPITLPIIHTLTASSQDGGSQQNTDNYYDSSTVCSQKRI
ncbi:hypothetical protein [Edaphobacter aggregans]|uniref:hypothetical protein n=1 Tax=Edaphobacter aggregans TaxID=570835 RepID=UPI0012FBE175|nr:hypothetical protein [Edaphobacter aggregans]